MFQSLSAVSDICQALCAFVSETGISQRVVPALLAALSASAGRGLETFFPITGVELGRRLGRSDVSAQGLARRWSRAWRLLDSEQRRTGLTLVERREGERDPRTRRRWCDEYRVVM